MLHALLVEDHDGHAALVADVTTLAEARAVLRVAVPDVVLCDLRGTSDVSPTEAARDLRIALDSAGASIRARVPMVLTSGVDPFVLHGIADSVRNTHALPKPFSRNDLRALVARVTGVTP
jgi:DNA-binding NarL/FixJ family response regulator